MRNATRLRALLEPTRGGTAALTGLLLATSLLACTDGPEPTEESARAAQPTAAQPLMIGGRPAPKGSFPSTVLVTQDGTTNRCTGHLLGPDVVLTAAHCFPPGARVRVNGVTGTCEEPAAVSSCPDGPDVALCALEGSFNDRDPFERLASTPGWATVGTAVTLVGLGANEAGAAPDGSEPRIGRARVAAPPDGESGCLPLRGGAVACRGDSGGGSFLAPSGAPLPLVGVISTGPCQSGGITQITDVTNTNVQEFVEEWTDRHPGILICGFHDDARRCRP